jgi:signal transduction histidine kinase/ActR/RegA family two-component response regulator
LPWYSFARLRTRVPEISAIVIIMVISALAFLTVEYRRTAGWVAHTIEAKAAIAPILTMLLDAEASNRGYVISGDDGFLTRYRRAAPEIAAQMDAVRRLVADNPVQVAALAALSPVIAARFEKLDRVAELRQTAGLDAVVVAFGNSTVETTTQLARDEIAAMQATEDGLLLSRTEAERQVTSAVAAIAILASLLVMAALAAWIANTRRDAAARSVTTAEREQKEAQIRQMQKIEAVGQLTGGLAHDLNNMLAVIISGLNLTQRRLAAGDTNVLRFVDAAMDGATRAASLTNRLMAFSRQQPLRPEALDANRLVGGMADMVQRTIGEAINTCTVLNAGLWLTSVDAGQLENAVLNLAINARDAMPEGGKLTIETANTRLDEDYGQRNGMPPGQYVMIAVTDTGTGMSAEVMEKAFDPFFTTKGVGKGTGLGLSQAFGFIKQSGGHIKIYSEPGHGTTVKMYLPRLFDAASGQVARSAAEETWPEARQDNARHLILVVEDDARVSEMTVLSLRELGYTVIHANGGTAALAMLERHPEAEVLFTDIVMPETNGRQLAAEVSRRRPDMKVLYTTGFTRDAVVHSGKLDAGVHFIAKPFTLGQIAAKMHEVLEAA